MLLPDGTNVNQELVIDGWCWWYRKYAPADTVLEGLEKAPERLRAVSESAPVPPSVGVAYLYLGSPLDSRQAIVEQILHQLASHLEMEEDLLFQEIRKSGLQGRKLLGDAELEHEEIKAMIYTLQRSETDGMSTSRT